MRDAIETMGTILTEDAGGRDAVHVAVIAVTASKNLMPGCHVGVEDPQAKVPVAGTTNNQIGIVDPFLKAEVRKGEKFWLYLYPRTITSLSHKWSHPAFPDHDPNSVYASPAQKAESEKWLREYAKGFDVPSYNDLIAVALGEEGDGGEYEWVAHPELHPTVGDFAKEQAAGKMKIENGTLYVWEYVASDDYRTYADGEYVQCSGHDAHGDIPSEVWDHAERITGKRMAERPKYYSCSC